MPRLTLTPPGDYDLARDVCSYGYFLLAPNRWHVESRTLTRVLSLPRGPVGVAISQPKGKALSVWLSHTLDASNRSAAISQITRMLRLDDDEATIAEFHRVDPRFATSGRGRLFRSPTLFEDVIKTVTSCNVTWPSTVQMNLRLSEVLGRGVDVEPARIRGAKAPPSNKAFPLAATIARTRPQTLRARCRVGYRDRRIVELSRLFRTPPKKGGIDTAFLEDPATPDDAVFDALVELPGIGPYAAANIMQLMGRYARLPLDTESVRHGRTLLGYKGSSAQIMKRLNKHRSVRRARVPSYWFELWEFYERKHGPAWGWERDSTGKMFTAALLNKA